MKVLYIIKREIDDTARKLIDQHREHTDVSIIDLSTDKNYADIVKQAFASDKVVCW